MSEQETNSEIELQNRSSQELIQDLPLANWHRCLYPCNSDHAQCELAVDIEYVMFMCTTLLLFSSEVILSGTTQAGPEQRDVYIRFGDYPNL